MQLIWGPRRSGKTTTLILMSQEHHIPIVVHDAIRREEILQMAHRLNATIPFPITVDDIKFRHRMRFKAGVDASEAYVDDFEQVLAAFLGMPVRAVTTTPSEWILRLEIDPDIQKQMEQNLFLGDWETLFGSQEPTSFHNPCPPECDDRDKCPDCGQ